MELEASGLIRVDGEVVHSDLAATLGRAAAVTPRPQLRVFADEEVPYRLVAGVLVDAQTAGFDAVGLAVEPRATGATPRTGS